MALAPHLVWNKIQNMPDGPEKDKRIKSFNRQMVICSYLYGAMILAMMVMTVVLVFVFMIECFKAA